jgi:hypothetical protein
MTLRFTLITTTVFSNVETVRFYDETLEHIKEQHPEIPIELPSIHQSVERAIVHPSHIEASYSNSYVFVDAETTNAFGDPLRVPVKIVEGTSARVKTVFFATTSGAPNIVWRKS